MNINELYELNKKEIDEINKYIKTKGVSLFGAGQYGQFACEYLLNNNYVVNYFIDNDTNKHNKKINNIEIIPKDSNLINDSEIIFITAHHIVNEILVDCKNKFKYIISFEKWFTLNNFYEFLKLQEYLFDERSKEVLISLMYSKILCDMKYIENIYDGEQYFASPKFKFGNMNEIFFNAGAYTGDTLERIVYTRFAGFKHIYAFEPGIKQFEAMNARVDRLKKEWAINDDKITLVNAAISNECKKVYYDTSTDLFFNKISSISTGHEINLYTIDSFLDGKEITFLISDIEGEELNMLKGAVETIKKYKPKMAISVYHRPDDLFTIPKFIKELVPEYNFDLRHHSIVYGDTVLYCWVNKDQTRPDQTRPDQY